MAMRQKTGALVGVTALAVVTTVLVVLSLLHVRPQTIDTIAQPPANTTVVAVGGPRQSPTPSPRPPRESTVANIKELLEGSDRVRIVVLGDATGLDDENAGGDRWVSLWAQELARARPVVVSTWRLGAVGQPRYFGSGNRAPIEILNASDLPGNLRDATAQVDTLIPDDIDLVIINFGHNEQEDRMAAELDAMWSRLPQGAMGLVIAQNPERGEGARGQRARAELVTAWANRKRVPVVDVFAAFIAAPEPLVQLLGRDQVNPNGRGSEVWLNAVVAALR